MHLFSGMAGWRRSPHVMVTVNLPSRWNKASWSGLMNPHLIRPKKTSVRGGGVGGLVDLPWNMVQFAKIIHRWSPPIYWSPPTWEPKRRNDLFQQLSLKYSCPQIRGFESGIIYIRIYYSCNDISIHRHHRQMAFQPCPISNSLGEGCGLGASSRNLIGNHYPMWPVFFP